MAREVAFGGCSCAALHTNAPSLNSDGIFDGRSLRHRLQPHDARIFTSWCSDHLPAPLTLAPPPPPQDASAAIAVAETATAEIAIAYAAEFINWVPLTAASASAIAPKAAPSTLPSPRPSPSPSPSALKAASHGLHLCRLRHHHPIHPHHRSRHHQGHNQRHRHRHRLRRPRLSRHCFRLRVRRHPHRPLQSAPRSPPSPSP